MWPYWKTLMKMYQTWCIVALPMKFSQTGKPWRFQRSFLFL
ncbi:hypothetical protein A2U01_0060728, partial [Trifolium medium]|nr:hypothetical protein [Trifolium medium]